MLAAAPPPAVLVTDFDIGDINGLDFIGEARAKFPCLKTLTKHPVKPDHFLPKPFRADALIGAVDRLAAESRTGAV